MITGNEEPFLREVRGLLDWSADQLDPATAARLRRARARAVAAAGGAARRRRRAWLPALGAAAAAILALWIGWSGIVDDRAHAPAAAAQLEAVDVLAGRGNLDLYENLGFYTWLADDAHHG